MFEISKIERDTTLEGETAPEISVILENGTLYVQQMNEFEDGTLHASIVGMSQGQAREVIKALSKFEKTLST